MSHWYDSTPKKSRRKRDSNPGSSALEADAFTTRPTRRSNSEGRGVDMNDEGLQLCGFSFLLPTAVKLYHLGFYISILDQFGDKQT